MPRSKEYLFESQSPLHTTYLDGRAVSAPLLRRTKNGEVVYEFKLHPDGTKSTESPTYLIFNYALRERVLDILIGDSILVYGDLYSKVTRGKNGKYRETTEFLVAEIDDNENI